MKHSKLILISFAIICLIAKYFDNIFDCQNSDYNCAWIAAALGAASSIGSSIFGSSASKKAIKKAQKLEDETHEQNQAFNLRRYNQDYGDTKAGQNLIRKANEYNTSGFTFRWLFITLWTIDSPSFEIAIVADTHWGVGLVGLFPYLRWCISIPCPERIGSWINKHFSRSRHLSF